MNQTLFTLKQLQKYKSALRDVLKNPAQSCSNVLTLTPEVLNANGVKVLILDFDGVLAGHASPAPCQDVLTWLEYLTEHWPHLICIFSNNPSVEREVFFKTHFPTIQFIKNVAPKPYPDGLIYIQEQTNHLASEILMVDDRLLTGILCALIAGVKPCLIKKPYQNFKKHPLKELLFTFFRKMDKILLL